VQENELDYSNFRNRADFGSAGPIFGNGADDAQSIRSATPSSFAHGRRGSSDSSLSSSRTGSPAPAPMPYGAAASYYYPATQQGSRTGTSTADKELMTFYPPSYHHPAETRNGESGGAGNRNQDGSRSRSESPLSRGGRADMRMTSFDHGDQVPFDGGQIYTVPSATDSEVRLLRGNDRG
jgi:hypothetical protein